MRIAFVGLDGCGKSTQVGRLHEWLVASGIASKVVDKWQIHDLATYPEHRFLGCSRDELRVCIAEMHAPSRALFLFWSIAATLPLSGSDDLVHLFDGYWQKHAASEVAYGCDVRWISDVTKIFPPADLTFHFDLEPAKALERKRGSLTPYECGRGPLTDANFLKHQRRVQRVLNDHFLFSGSKEVQRVDASLTPDEVFSFVRDTVKARLNMSLREIPGWPEPAVEHV